jgi:hypothetical protein
MRTHAVFFIRTGIALLAANAIGCAAAEVTPTADQAYKPSAPAAPLNDEDGGEASVGASAVATPHALGSPLCNATYSSCYPDEDLTALINNLSTTHGRLCVLAADGGLYSASSGFSNAQLACHVQSDLLGDVAPTCTLAGTLTDDSSKPCSAPTDCAAGYECVAGGACRHYCCAGECLDPTKFCDIQQTTVNLKVPVCMPIRSCGLLDQSGEAGACPLGQTCAVVRVESGATSCVAVGSSDVGDPCDKEQCASGLVCLGAAGDRHCYKLCHTAPGSTDCLSSRQTCRGGLPLFPIPGIGICQ